MEGDTEGLGYLRVADEFLGGDTGAVASTGGVRLSRHLQQQREGQVSQRLSDGWSGLAAFTRQTSLVISDEILHTSLAGNGKDRHHQLVDSVGVTRHAVGVLVYAVDVVLREELLVKCLVEKVEFFFYQPCWHYYCCCLDYCLCLPPG